FGHIIEIIEADGDHTAPTGRWEILLKCGDPSVAAVGATFSTDTTKSGWFGMPDNAVVEDITAKVGKLAIGDAEKARLIASAKAAWSESAGPA
ncbi:MAG: alkaline phosphatase PhoX, partial [Sphingopyxis sp.]|uniref:alkaline phosphatase PhoX n=1 Tax=Sphingopyxis sp. TaxID=1908224 RepID=UPI004036F8DA